MISTKLFNNVLYYIISGRHGNASQGTPQQNRKNVISCVTVPDSDSEGYYSPLQALPHFTSNVIGKVVKPEPQKEKSR